jgi:hypothetical protein
MLRQPCLNTGILRKRLALFQSISLKLPHGDFTQKIWQQVADEAFSVLRSKHRHRLAAGWSQKQPGETLTAGVDAGLQQNTTSMSPDCVERGGRCSLINQIDREALYAAWPRG